MSNTPTPSTRPPSVDALARSLAQQFTLPHSVLVDCARHAISTNPARAQEVAHQLAQGFSATLIGDVINGTGVLLHTNLGRAPLPHLSSGRASNLEFNLGEGTRGTRHRAISELVRILTGAEDAIVVNNNAAAVMLVLAALARGRGVAVSRGESVEIGGGFRIPDVMEQSGVRIVDVGTTNRTRLNDYVSAIANDQHNIAIVLKVHPSNFSIQGFTESTSVSDLSTLEVPVVVDIGSGLIDNTCPWLHGHLDHVPAFLLSEPAARQTLEAGADLVTFSGDKLLGGPQCGIIAGNAELIALCAAHPLMRALRPGGHTLSMLQSALLSHAARSACDDIPFWKMLSTPLNELHTRAQFVVNESSTGRVGECHSLIGAGSAPGTTIDSFAVIIERDITRHLRSLPLPIVARVESHHTIIDMRTIQPSDDHLVIDALRHLP
jgi:L-seryl-tRNA(Ser) seleniumtransferase